MYLGCLQQVHSSLILFANSLEKVYARHLCQVIVHADSKWLLQKVVLLNTPWLNRKIIRSLKYVMSAQSCKQKQVDQVNAFQDPKPH